MRATAGRTPSRLAAGKLSGGRDEHGWPQARMVIMTALQRQPAYRAAVVNRRHAGATGTGCAHPGLLRRLLLRMAQDRDRVGGQPVAQRSGAGGSTPRPALPGGRRATSAADAWRGRERSGGW